MDLYLDSLYVTSWRVQGQVYLIFTEDIYSYVHPPLSLKGILCFLSLRTDSFIQFSSKYKESN